MVKVDIRGQARRGENPAEVQGKHTDDREKRLVDRWEGYARHLRKLQSWKNRNGRFSPTRPTHIAIQHVSWWRRVGMGSGEDSYHVIFRYMSLDERYHTLSSQEYTNQAVNKRPGKPPTHVIRMKLPSHGYMYCAVSPSTDHGA